MTKLDYLPKIKPLSRPTVVEIDLKNLEHNLKVLRTIVGSDVNILAVVKADAYGHGSIPITKRLAEKGVWGFGVALVEEGIELRLNKIENPILVLNGVETYEALQYAIEYDLTPVIFNYYQLSLFRDYIKRNGFKERLKVHLKVDTGMNRLGFTDEEFSRFIEEYWREFSWLSIEGVMSHLAYADDSEEELTKRQYLKFKRVIERLHRIGIHPKYKHLANSASIIRFPYTHFNMVRPGLMLYGVNPTNGRFRVELDLKPVMRLKTKIIQIKMLKPGDRVSYGGSFVAKRPTKIAVLPIGYGDGIPRLLSNRGEVLVKGRRAKIVGNICMDLLMIDVTEIEDIREGEDVIILGRDGEEEISAESIAALLGTIPYEVLTSISLRIPRNYL